jgi:hypothetical protein
MSGTGSSGCGPGRRRLRTVADVLAVGMIMAGAVFAGISISQHQHHDSAVAAETARKAQIDRAAQAEARRSRTARPLRGHSAGFSGQVAGSGTAHPDRPTVPGPERAPQQRTEAGPSGRPSLPGRHISSSARYRGVVSEIGGPGATLVIPALGVRAPIVATGAVGGSMTVPADIHTVGWYDGVDASRAPATSAPTAPWPGQPGVSLLAGHVDWAGEGPGALYYINQLVVGDPIEVVGSNRETTRWRVSQAPLTISKSALPAGLFVNTGPAKLALVTCGGPFDAATRHYLDNVVVWATPVLS